MPTYNNLPATSEYFKGKLYDRMVEDLRLAGKAKRTVYGYVRAVRKLADFCQTTPEQICEQQVRVEELEGSRRRIKMLPKPENQSQQWVTIFGSPNSS